jgi:ribonuclease HI
MEKIKIYTDGGARGNPGPAALGAVIELGKSEKEYAQFLGKLTNNEAEYQAAIFGLKKLRQLVGKKEAKEKKVEIYSDSELMVKQMSGLYKIRGENLFPLFITLRNLTLDFKKVDFKAIPREENKKADALVNQALDKESSSQLLI